MYTERVNRDYVPDGTGGFRQCTGAAATLSEALFRLECRRGAFPALPELGSRLHTLGREKRAAREALARQYAAEALEGLGLSVEGASVTEDAEGRLHVALSLRQGGTEWEVTV